MDLLKKGEEKCIQLAKRQYMCQEKETTEQKERERKKKIETWNK